MASHTLRFGSHEVTYEEHDLLAVHWDTALRSFATRGTRPMPVRFGSTEIEPMAQAAFGRSGWHFGASRPGMEKAASRGESFGLVVPRRVLQAPDGSIAIDTGRAAVALPPDMDTRFVPGELARSGLVARRRLPIGDNVYEARIAPGLQTLETIAELQHGGRFEFVEPELLEHLGPRWTPVGAAGYAQQWQHRNDGSNGGLIGADANLERAWDVTRGRRSDDDRPIRIAVIDNGFALVHPALSGALDSGGLFKDDGTGSWIFVRRGGAPFPSSRHGTFCAGMASARPTRTGGCGSAPESALIPVACLVDQVGTQTTLAMALVYAALPHEIDGSATADQGADVVSCSLGPNGAVWRMSQTLSLAIERVVRGGRGGLGTVLVWAVSNGDYDVAFDEVSSDPRVLGIGRSTRLDGADKSASGAGLDFLAPGVDVYSTTPKGWGSSTGTSFAAPLVAGIAGLLLARHPALTRDQAAERLRATCRQVGGGVYVNGRNDEHGHGRVDAEAALR